MLDKIDTLIVFSHVKSVAKTAKEKGMSISGVSFQLHQLEKYFECKLFKDERPLALSVTGKVLVVYGINLLRMVECIKNIIHTVENVDDDLYDG